MSSRPRFANTGTLARPSRLRVLRDGAEDAGDVVGVMGNDAWDPFKRTSEGVLLAESFARVDLSRPRTARAWFAEHGVADIDRFLEADDHGRGRFHDHHGAVLAQQALVRWHLDSLRRLSIHSDVEWDGTWSQPALLDPYGEWTLWLGGRSRDEMWMTQDMRRYPSIEAMDPLPLSIHDVMDWDLGVSVDEFTGSWWSTAHATWQRIVGEGIPVLPVPQDGWEEHWQDYAAGSERPYGRSGSERLADGRAGLLELERRLIEPYVRRAAAADVQLDREHADPSAPFAIVERRRWTSILAPIYLQLAEALIRISEGRSGAKTCRECGQVFLTLDARRLSFCNDPERLRNLQRAHRRRKAEGITRTEGHR